MRIPTVIALMLLLGTSGCHLVQPEGGRSPRETAVRQVSATQSLRKFVVYVTGNGFHTGLVLKTADVPRDVWPEVDRLPDHSWIEVGWGSEIFYRATAITPGIVLGAIFPNASVLHLVGWDAPPEEVFPGDIVRLEIDDEGMAALCSYIHETYELDDQGRPLYLGDGIYGDSSFFRARGSYYFPNTCNVWTATALRRAGIATIPQISVTTSPVLRSARRAGTIVRRR